MPKSNMKPVAMISGITGQDGYYLAKLLLEKGYIVHGFSTDIENCLIHDKNLVLEQIDLNSHTDMQNYIEKHQPKEFYNLAAISFIPASWRQSTLTFETNTLAVGNILESIRLHSPETRLFQAGSAEIFGEPISSPQNEETVKNPRNPYGISKLAAMQLLKVYREKYDLHVSTGIFYNHESALREPSFVTKKIVEAAKIISGQKIENIFNKWGEPAIEDDGKLHIGNMESKRDWGHVVDYMDAVHLITTADKGGDYIIATGELHSVKEFIIAAFKHVGISDWEKHVVVDDRFYRPAEKINLVGNISKITKELGWKPKIQFEKLVELMFDEI